MAPADALLDGPGPPFVSFEQLRAVVGLDYERIDIANAVSYIGRGETEVGQPSETFDWGEQIVAPSASEFETNRVVGIVGQGKAFDRQIAEGEG